MLAIVLSYMFGVTFSLPYPVSSLNFPVVMARTAKKCKMHVQGVQGVQNYFGKYREQFQFFSFFP